MKSCPYCGSEIRDEAIKCRWCLRMLPEGPGEPAQAPLPPAPGRESSGAGDEALQYTHSGERYLLGYGDDFFGIWDRQGAEGPIERHPRTGEGWQLAWSRYSALESHPVQVGLGPSGPPSGGLPERRAPSWPGPRPRPARVNPLWWLAPILVGWIGGLVAWLVNREADPRTARAMLVTGIASSILAGVLLLVLGPPGQGL